MFNYLCFIVPVVLQKDIGIGTERARCHLSIIHDYRDGERQYTKVYNEKHQSFAASFYLIPLSLFSE